MGRLILAGAVLVAGMLSVATHASAQVYGSFMESCAQIEQRGPYLRALCRDVYGRFVPSRLDLRACQEGSVANQNGRLVCEGQRQRAYRRYEQRPRVYDYPPEPPRGGYYAPY